MLTKDNHDMYTKPPDGCAQFCTHCTASYLNICAPGRLFFFFFYYLNKFIVCFVGLFVVYKADFL
jgi:hypothetical protein